MESTLLIISYTQVLMHIILGGPCILIARVRDVRLHEGLRSFMVSVLNWTIIFERSQVWSGADGRIHTGKTRVYKRLDFVYVGYSNMFDVPK